MAGMSAGPGMLEICVWNWSLLNLRTANSNFGTELTGFGETILQRPQPQLSGVIKAQFKL